MKIALLTTHICEQKIEEQKLISAAKKRGLNLECINAMECSISISPRHSEIYYKDQAIHEKFDVIIPRIDMPHIDYGLTILRQFEALNVYCTDTADSIAIGHNKIQSMQCLVDQKIPFPTTGYAYSKESFAQVLQSVGGAPLVTKLLQGTEGIGIFLAEDSKQAQNILKTFKQLSAPVLVQEFIEDSAGEDVRAFVIGDKVVASMVRKSNDDDFRANVSLGGTSEVTQLSKEEEKIVLKTATALDMNIAGIDFVRSKSGPLIIEINTAPDFSGPYGLDEVSGIDVAGEIIDYALTRKRSHKSFPLRKLKAA